MTAPRAALCTPGIVALCVLGLFFSCQAEENYLQKDKWLDEQLRSCLLDLDKLVYEVANKLDCHLRDGGPQ